jgi:hypothetical protein
LKLWTNLKKLLTILKKDIIIRFTKTIGIRVFVGVHYVWKDKKKV